MHYSQKLKFPLQIISLSDGASLGQFGSLTNAK